MGAATCNEHHLALARIIADSVHSDVVALMRAHGLRAADLNNESMPLVDKFKRDVLNCAVCRKEFNTALDQKIDAQNEHCVNLSFMLTLAFRDHYIASGEREQYREHMKTCRYCALTMSVLDQVAEGR